MPKPTSTPSRRNSNQTASGKPGAVQALTDPLFISRCAQPRSSKAEGHRKVARRMLGGGEYNAWIRQFRDHNAGCVR